MAILTGGGDRPYALGLASALSAAGVPMDFIGSDDLDAPELHDDPLVRFLNLRGSQRPDAPRIQKVVRVAVYYLRLIRYAAESKARVFHLLWNNKFEAVDRTLLMLYYRALGKRTALTVHNVNKRKRDGRDTWWNRLTLGAQYRMVDHLFVHTEQMKRELMGDFSVPASKVSVIPFGLNSTVPDTALTPAEARRRLGIADGERVLLFFGNIAPYKGLEYLVEAGALLARQGMPCRLLIAGRPKGAEAYWAGIEQRLREPDLAPLVTARIEYVPDADTEVFFKAADALVLPYTTIFQSGVLFLGYNFGLPVIASDVGSLKEDIIEGETGTVCRPLDAADLARAIHRFFSSPLQPDPESRRSSIRQWAQERFAWSTVAATSLDVYSRLTP